MLESMPKSQTTFFFYDLETSGVGPREARIMQFAGQRTDMELRSVGEPVNVLIKLTPDVLPEPDAILLTGITPQSTLQDGITEAEFLKLFTDEVATPGTIFIGYNSVRFDDEFMRYAHYRNFYDPYSWQWQDGRGKWDLLDVVRMTRALRPEGINWPFAPDGKPTVRLEFMTKVNKLLHDGAHDALVDVNATIALAQLIRGKQPKLFDYLLSMRDKKAISELVFAGQPFVYTSGKYANEFEKTTVVATIARHPKKAGALVYDLRHDPTEFIGLKPAELVERWKWTRDEDAPKRLPVKTLQFNRCPALAPLGVLKEGDAMKQLEIDLQQIEANRQKLAAAADFQANLLTALEMMDKQQQIQWAAEPQAVDAQLYDGFFDEHDQRLLPVMRAAEPGELTALVDEVHDSRLKALLPLYQARNYPRSLSDEQRKDWEAFCQQRLQDGGPQSRLNRFAARLQQLGERTDLTQKQRYILEELQLYAESIVQLPEE
jgi:exodeoxyribonuclease-1